MAKLDEFKAKVVNYYNAGNLGMLQSWAGSYPNSAGRQFAATYAAQLAAAQQAAQAAAAGGTAAAQLGASQQAGPAHSASPAAQQAGQAEAQSAKLNTGRRAMVSNRKGVLGMAQEFAKTRKTKLGG